MYLNSLSYTVMACQHIELTSFMLDYPAKNDFMHPPLSTSDAQRNSTCSFKFISQKIFKSSYNNHCAHQLSHPWHQSLAHKWVSHHTAVILIHLQGSHGQETLI